MSDSYYTASPPPPPPKSGPQTSASPHPPVPPRPPQAQSPSQQRYSYIQTSPSQVQPSLPQYQDTYRQPPPPPPQQPISPVQHHQQYPPQTQSYQPQHQPQSPPPQHGPPAQTQNQVQPDWLPPHLKDHTLPDLQSALSNTTLLQALSQQHPAYAASQEPLQAAIKQNLQLAQSVAQLEQQLTAMRDQTTQLMLNHTSLQTQWRRKQTEMDDALSPWGPRVMYQRLVASIGEQESILTAVFESFLDGASYESNDYSPADTGGSARDGKASDKEVADWIKRIREGATVLEKRREMRARWDEGRVGGWR